MSFPNNKFTKHAGIEIPIICGAMYPCSNPELVAAVSEAGGMGIVQPVALAFAHKYDFRKGLQYIKQLTSKPFGLNIIVEKTAKVYERRMQQWLDIAIEEGVRFFVTSLGSPQWVVSRAHANNGIVYHDITERKWGMKALETGVDGLICVNSRAGGHAGQKTPEQLAKELRDLGVPLICAGGIGSEQDFVQALELGFSGVQMGTAFIATDECSAHADYKQAIINATGEDIILTDKISGVPCAVIRTAAVEKMGTKAGFLARQLLKGRKTKKWMRLYYNLQSLWKLKRAAAEGGTYKDYWCAGKSVDGIQAIEPAAAIVQRFAAAVEQKT